MSQTTVQIEVDINPTESEEKVRKAVWNLFGEVHVDVKPSQKGGVLTADVKGQDSLSTLRNVLRRDHIRDASRKALYHGLRDTTLTIYLNKQAAFAGHVSFSEVEAESPLGPLKVTVQTDAPQQLVDWLAPRTGKP